MDDYKTITVSTGEKIFVFNNFFSASENYNFFDFARRSSYRVFGSAQDCPDYWFYGCALTQQDVDNMGFFKSSSINKINEFVQNTKIIRQWILSSSSSTKILYHADSTGSNQMLSLTYYLNPTWNKDWGGETLFCNDFGQPEIAIEYQPNTLILFPSKLLHKPTSHYHSLPRYSMSMVFEKEL